MPNPPPEVDFVPNLLPANHDQKMYLVSFMERHKKFSLGEYQSTKDDFRNRWEDLKIALNNFPGASVKTVAKWQKVRAIGIKIKGTDLELLLAASRIN